PIAIIPAVIISPTKFPTATAKVKENKNNNEKELI
ncbi:hypothetical protein NT04LM_3353a, partial [Listeria monocytogenes FSL F2-208]